MAKLYRSTTDRKIFGVCGGLAKAVNVDVTLLRFVVVIATIFSGGTGLLLYLAAAIVIPVEPDNGASANHQGWFEFGYRPFQGHGKPPHHSTHHYGAEQSGQPAPGATHASGQYGMGGMSGAKEEHLDELMKEVETKALRKEIEELKQRLAKFENGKQDQEQVQDK